MAARRHVFLAILVPLLVATSLGDADAASLEAVTNVSLGGGRVYAGGFLRDSRDGSPDTFAAAAVPVPS